MTNTELISLLDEARDFMVDSCRECSRESTSLRVRIDAALAERLDKPPCSCGQPYPCMEGCPDCCHSQGYLDYCQGDRHAERQDSAKDVVEWLTVKVEFKTKQNVVLIGKNGRLQLEVERLKRLSEGKS